MDTLTKPNREECWRKNALQQMLSAGWDSHTSVPSSRESNMMVVPVAFLLFPTKRAQQKHGLT